ncbi:hypothetical protein TrLO_g10701 [Triparma laevis f. longispina]|uniref:Uncharacterized protein n=1 Tax=Triparma laevis f. longispina TaxID=1714387 RepID=A0A9W7F7H0_9STRA|nr:hypothetical protein TrLO_g10701 [Triparma laevis f. longispina]
MIPGFLAQVSGLFTILGCTKFGGIWASGLDMTIDAVIVCLINTPIAYGFSRMSLSSARLAFPCLVFVVSFLLAWSPLVKGKNIALAVFYLPVATTFATGTITEWWRPLSLGTVAVMGVVSAFMVVLIVPSVSTWRLETGTATFKTDLSNLKKSLLLLFSDLRSTHKLDVHSTHARVLALRIHDILASLLANKTSMATELTLRRSITLRNSLLLEHSRLTTSIESVKLFLDIALSNSKQSTNVNDSPEVDEMLSACIEAISGDLSPTPSFVPTSLLEVNASIHALINYHESLLSPTPPAPFTLYNPLSNRKFFGGTSLSHFKYPVKVSISLCLASLFATTGLLYETSFGAPPFGLGWLTGLHVSLICVPGDGGSYEKSVQRLIGNGLACGFALIVYQWFQVRNCEE